VLLADWSGAVVVVVDVELVLGIGSVMLVVDVVEVVLDDVDDGGSVVDVVVVVVGPDLAGKSVAPVTPTTARRTTATTARTTATTARTTATTAHTATTKKP